MKLDCVLTAVNELKSYIDFIPIFIRTWNKLYPSVDVKIVLVDDKIPERFSDYRNNIILFKPLQGISTVFTSQYIRLLYPALLNYEHGIMITDIDNLPMNRTFFTENIKDIADNKWVNLRNWKTRDQICMMWQIANKENWKAVFQIRSIRDIKIRLTNRFHNSKRYKWFIDQLDLYKHVLAWNNKTHGYQYLVDDKTGFKRLNRNDDLSKDNIHTLPENIVNNIKNGIYSDYHSLRPYEKYKDINEKIYTLL